MRRDFKAYHESLVAELDAVQNRVRNLIGDAHWGTDGAHKESVLRSVLRKHVPESLRVGSGFVCFPPNQRDDTSGQLDILVTKIDKPTLYKEGDLVIATPDSAVAAIEVKSEARHLNLTEVLTKLSDVAEQVRRCRNPDFRVGLFVFSCEDADHPSDDRVLRALQEASHSRIERVVNWVAIGPDRFFRFWEDGTVVRSDVREAVWHWYDLRRLAQSYFIANVVWDTCPGVPHDMQFAWFPIERSEGTKERYRRFYCSLRSGTPEEFRRNR